MQIIFDVEGLFTAHEVNLSKLYICIIHDVVDIQMLTLFDHIHILILTKDKCLHNFQFPSEFLRVVLCFERNMGIYCL